MGKIGNLCVILLESTARQWEPEAPNLLHIIEVLITVSVLVISLIYKSYSFQTPEGWNTKDQCRSLCYMRPLAIWAMQWALTRTNIFEPEIKPEVKEDSLFRQHSGFSKVFRLLKLPEETTSRSLLQVAYDYTKKKIRM